MALIWIFHRKMQLHFKDGLAIKAGFYLSVPLWFHHTKDKTREKKENSTWIIECSFIIASILISSDRFLVVFGWHMKWCLNASLCYVKSNQIKMNRTLSLSLSPNWNAFHAFQCREGWELNSSSTNRIKILIAHNPLIYNTSIYCINAWIMIIGVWFLLTIYSQFKLIHFNNLLCILSRTSFMIFYFVVTLKMVIIWMSGVRDIIIFIQ